MPTKPFNIAYKVPTATGFMVLNGEQITRIVFERVEDSWQITFHLSDGEKVRAGSPEWTKAFAEDLDRTVFGSNE